MFQRVRLINRWQYEQLLRHLNDVYPEEGCGLIAGNKGITKKVYPIRNMLASKTAFEMEPIEQLTAMLDMDNKGLDLLAIYHSHPSGPPVPSETDISNAYYPEAAHLIISWESNHKPTLRAFSILAGRATEQQLIVG